MTLAQILRNMTTGHGNDSDGGTEDGERRSFRDVPSELGGERTYECHICGEIRVEEGPGVCSECGTSMRNRGAPVE